MKTAAAVNSVSWLLVGLLLLPHCQSDDANRVTDNTDGSAADSSLESERKKAKATKASVGQRIFFDATLSEPAGQACATCHDPAHGYADGRPSPTSQGATSGRFGVRNTPGINYASFTPPLAVGGNETGYSGGLFWDGRAISLQIQAGGPLLNPLEMNNPNKDAVIAKIKAGAYAAEFKQVFGKNAFADTEQAFSHLVDAVAAFETLSIPNRFSSKYDAYLAGKAQLTDSETRGLALFDDPKKGNCASCHMDKPDDKGNPPLFTDFGYDNLGIPKNPANPYYTLPADLNPSGANFIDYGLGGSIHNPRQAGKFKAPTLRNLALTAPYGHNGYFADIKAVVDFYNTRDVPGRWEAPEVSAGLNTADMGNLGLSDQDVDDMVAFMETLTDGYAPAP